jgi:hypothetical protein
MLQSGVSEWTKRDMRMTDDRTPAEPNLRYLEYSPDVNPLVEVRDVPIKRRLVSTGLKTDLVDADGVIQGASVIRTIEEKDDAEFVKVFAAGVAASFGLSKTGRNVFHAVLRVYQAAPMHGGFADTVYLKWFDDGLCGNAIEMSEKTFRRGLKELLALGFLSPRTPSVFWINPALFFKGSRVLFVQDYRRKANAQRVES